MDPDIEVAKRRILGFRRAMVIHVGAEQMIKDIFTKYHEQGHPAICNDDKDPEIGKKVLGGEPTSKARATLRSQCKPQGPVGFMLESLHIQAAMMDDTYKIHQFNQPCVDILEVP